MNNSIGQLARDFGLPLLDLDALDTEALPTSVVSTKLIQQHRILPLHCRGRQLFVAVANPTQQAAIDAIKFHTGLSIHCIVVEEEKLNRYIENLVAVPAEVTRLKEPEEDTSITHYIDKILIDAIKKGASDLHFEPYEQQYRIRARLDGILYELVTPPLKLANPITVRLKIMAQLDISERRLPQDGRFKMMLAQNHTIDFRVNSCPTVNGEKIVIRILDPDTANFNMDAIGFESWQKEIFQQAIIKSQGMILVTGPTGSGKTVTLYAALNALNTGRVNISTVEDPVEIQLFGINQVNINLKAGLTFATVLRAFLRQDPDIIMVGEMRDLETAEIAIKAAQTGHLLLSTLHTNSASETLTRLANMGVLAYNIATSTTLIIAQRLARQLCEYCKVPVRIPAEELIREGFAKSEINHLLIYQPVGCEQCIQGYKGRLGIFELLPITERIQHTIMQGGSVLDIAAQAEREGMRTLRAAGLDKVRAGLTSLTEINRITKD